jgi:hypothetical protein
MFAWNCFLAEVVDSLRSLRLDVGVHQVVQVEGPRHKELASLSEEVVGR